MAFTITDVVAESAGSVFSVVVTTSAVHGFEVGQRVKITGVVGVSVNNIYEINGTPSATTFQILIPDVGQGSGSYVSGGAVESTPLYGISAASNDTPIWVTSTNVMSGFDTGMRVTIAGVLGNTAANGTWTIMVVNQQTISLDNSVGNGEYTSGGTIELVADLGDGVITEATNASPIVITTSAAHGYVSGAIVEVASCTGNTAANGRFAVTVIDATHFIILASSGNGVYVGSGTCSGVINTPKFITNATNATPIVITSVGHGLVNSPSLLVQISNVRGANISDGTSSSAANGLYAYNVVDDDTFELWLQDDPLAGPIAGNADYVLKGRCYPDIELIVGQVKHVTKSATPIQVTTTAAHGRTTGDQITIDSIRSPSAANGAWTITVVDATNFTLDTSTGDGNVYLGGGIIELVPPYTNITNATNAAPIQITTDVAHGRVNGDRVFNKFVRGNLAANSQLDGGILVIVPAAAGGDDSFLVTRVDDTNFTMNGTTGSGAFYSPGGEFVLVPNLMGTTGGGFIGLDIEETSTFTGTDEVDALVAVAGKSQFSILPDKSLVDYRIEAGAVFETGLAEYIAAADELVRLVINQTSEGTDGEEIDFSAGAKNVKGQFVGIFDSIIAAVEGMPTIPGLPPANIIADEIGMLRIAASDTSIYILGVTPAMRPAPRIGIPNLPVATIAPPIVEATGIVYTQQELNLLRFALDDSRVFGYATDSRGAVRAVWFRALTPAELNNVYADLRTIVGGGTIRTRGINDIIRPLALGGPGIPVAQQAPLAIQIAAAAPNAPPAGGTIAGAPLTRASRFTNAMRFLRPAGFGVSRIIPGIGYILSAIQAGAFISEVIGSFATKFQLMQGRLQLINKIATTDIDRCGLGSVLTYTPIWQLEPGYARITLSYKTNPAAGSPQVAHGGEFPLTLRTYANPGFTLPDFLGGFIETYPYLELDKPSPIPFGYNPAKLPAQTTTKAGIPCDIFIAAPSLPLNSRPPFALRATTTDNIQPRLFYLNWFSATARNDGANVGHNVIEQNFRRADGSAAIISGRFLDAGFADVGASGLDRNSSLYLYLGTLVPVMDGVAVCVPRVRLLWNAYNRIAYDDFVSDRSLFLRLNVFAQQGYRNVIRSEYGTYSHYWVNPNDAGNVRYPPVHARGGRLSLSIVGPQQVAARFAGSALVAGATGATTVGAGNAAVKLGLLNGTPVDFDETNLNLGPLDIPAKGINAIKVFEELNVADSPRQKAWGETPTNGSWFWLEDYGFIPVAGLSPAQQSPPASLLAKTRGFGMKGDC